MTALSTIAADRAAIERRALEIAETEVAETAYVAYCEGAAPVTIERMLPFARQLAEREAAHAAKFAAAPQALRDRLAEIDAMPIKRIDPIGPSAIECERRRIIKQIYGA